MKPPKNLNFFLKKLSHQEEIPNRGGWIKISLLAKDPIKPGKCGKKKPTSVANLIQDKITCENN